MSAYIDTILENPQYAVLSAISIITILVVNFSFFTQDEKYPFLIPKKPLELTDRRVVKEFLANSKSLLAKSRTVYKDQPYRAYTELGKVLVIPPSWVEALKSNRQLDFLLPTKDDAHQYIPGFDPFGFDAKMPTVINKYITKALEWHGVKPQEDLIRIVSRVSSRIFMGEELCRDKEWNKVSSEYTLMVFGYSGALREYPRWIRPYIHWFLPQCWAIRAKLNEARQCLKLHIERRNAIKRQALAEGKLCAFRRVAIADVTLPNGDILKKGDKIIGNMSHMWDSDTYDNALQFDPYRFVKMRQTGDDKKAHLVSTSADHLGFGHGFHACPGRFFAANEIKILLCHMLLKYDWKLPEGCTPRPHSSGFKLYGDYSSNLLVRRRTEELDIDSLSRS
ncbi:hypothetical protein H9Q74_004536 [Fusarium xylarioides]|nr:hypothetical protein H9Q71_004746 [Fusarium xylarioides]KAG5825360.1 hypothetical protein H9Q74_004536 [Fusarium xylarioides]